jgi:SlyX protein
VVRAFGSGRQYISVLCPREQAQEKVALADSDDIRQLLVDLQTQLAYQEDTLRELNEAMAGQQQEIIQLRRQLQLLKQRQDEQAPLDASQPSPADEKPPHY